MPKKVKTTAQLHSSHMIAKSCSKLSKIDFNSMWTEKFQMFKLDIEKERNQRSNCQHPLDHRKSKRIPEIHLLLLYWLHQSLWLCAAAAAKSLQSCLTLCDPRDGSPPGSLVPGILQARTLEWVAISFSNAWKWKVKVKSFSRIRLFTTPWTAAYQAPPPMGFSRQEYRSGVPLPSLD